MPPSLRSPEAMGPGEGEPATESLCSMGQMRLFSKSSGLHEGIRSLAGFKGFGFRGYCV